MPRRNTNSNNGGVRSSGGSSNHSETESLLARLSELEGVYSQAAKQLESATGQIETLEFEVSSLRKGRINPSRELFDGCDVDLWTHLGGLSGEARSVLDESNGGRSNDLIGHSGYPSGMSERRSRGHLSDLSGHPETSEQASSGFGGSAVDHLKDLGEHSGQAATMATSSSGSSSTRQADKEESEQTLPEDTFSFLIMASGCSTSFNAAILVFSTQMTVFLLMLFDITETSADNGNYFGFPVNIDTTVRAGQVVALIITILTQGDVIKGLELIRVGQTSAFQDAIPNLQNWRVFICIFVLLLEGTVGIMASMILILVSDNVFDLLLNFTAMGFVSELDEVVFMLATHGFAGTHCEATAELVNETSFNVPKKKLRGTKMFMLTCLFAGMVAGWGVVVNNQVTGKYLCSTILVQYGDDMMPALGTFSGLYDLQTEKSSILGSQYMRYVDRQSGRATFGYCGELGAWTMQWNNGDVSAESDPCNWVARSSETATYDLTKTASATWYVQDMESSRVVELHPFFLACYDCGGTDGCNGQGSCTKAICSCNDGWYGLRCEFLEPCQSLVMDARTEGFLGTRRWSSSFHRLTDEDATRVDSYFRPVYISKYQENKFDLIFFTGRRWAVTYSDLLFSQYPKLLAQANNTKRAVSQYFNEEFHAHWSNYSIVFVSEPVDVSSPKDANSPQGLDFFSATTKKSNKQLGIQAPDNLKSEASILCAICNNETNPCLYDGVCISEACECSLMSTGALCEVPPVGNGFCNPYFNEPIFNYDGGDCCEQTCHNGAEFACGMDQTGFGSIGYYYCKLPKNEWYHDPETWKGIMVALSPDGTFLAVGDPSESRATFYDRVGKDWIQRAPPLDIRHDSLDGTARLLITSAARQRVVTTNSIKAPYMLTFPNGENDLLTVVNCTDTCEKLFTVANASAYDISSDGMVLAVGAPTDGRIQIYSLQNITAPQIVDTITVTDDPCVIMSISVAAYGKILAVQTHFSNTAAQTIQLFDWDGGSYIQRGSFLQQGSTGQFQFGPKMPMAMSEDGSVIGFGVYESGNPAVQMNTWGEGGGWLRMGLIPASHSGEDEGDGSRFTYLSVALSHDGKTVTVNWGIGGFIVYDWSGDRWLQVGEPILLGGFPEYIALSSDGSILAAGSFVNGYQSGIQKAHVFSTSPRRSCSDGMSFLRSSLTTDRYPYETYWDIVMNDTGAVLLQVKFDDSDLGKASYVDERCIRSDSCHIVTIYDTWGDGMHAPGRYDIFLDGKDIGSGDFSIPSPLGVAKRVFAGGGCLSCPEGSQLFSMLVQACDPLSWDLEDSSGRKVFTDGILGYGDLLQKCYDRKAYWKDVCLNLSQQCYTINFSRAPTSLPVNDAEYKPDAPKSQYVLFIENEPVTQRQFFGNETSATSLVGMCNSTTST